MGNLNGKPGGAWVRREEGKLERQRRKGVAREEERERDRREGTREERGIWLGNGGRT